MMALQPTERTIKEKEVILEQLFAAAKRIIIAQCNSNENQAEALHFLALTRTCALQSLRDKDYEYFSTDNTGGKYWAMSAPVA